MPTEAAVSKAVVFHEYPKLIYAWPIIVLGFVFWPLAAPRTVVDTSAEPAIEAPAAEAAGRDAQPVQPTVRVSGEHEVLGWIYLLALLLVLLTLSVDVERNYAFFWGLAFVTLWLLGWLLHEKNIPVFREIYGFFADLDVSYDRGLGLAMSVILALPYLVMLVWTRMNHRWRITHNEFEHLAWGRADDSLARGAKRVRTTYPDLLEFLLCGAGTLIVYSATGRDELRRIHNVPFLFLVRNRIDRILESTQVTLAEAQQDSQRVFDDEAESQEAEGGGEVGGEKL